jgi:hypothetical protein
LDAIEEVVPPAARPFGVSAAAVVAILGSLFVILTGLMIATVPAVPPGTADTPPISDSAMRTFAIGISIALVGLGAFGAWTGISLFNLRPWARTSIMVFAGIMTAICVTSIIAFAMIPFPVPKSKPAVDTRMLKPFLLLVYAIPGLIGAWWLVQFNRPATKAAFAGIGPVTEPERPLSITIIAWVFLIGALGSLIPIIAKMPFFFAGIVLTGWQGQIGYLVYAVISLLLGRGLLKLDERARKLSLAYFALTAIHMILVSIIPAWRDRMTSVQSDYAPRSAAPPVGAEQIIILVLIFGALFWGAGTWFLIKNKKAFR